MKRWISFLVSVLVFVRISSQEPRFTHFEAFKVEDGLPQNFISGIQQDQDGFLWIGTRDGLARYDGRSFRVFRPKTNDSLSLSSNIITGLYLDAKNLLWVFYVNDRVDCFDPRRMQVLHEKPVLAAGGALRTLRSKKILRDRPGNFWITSNDRGIAFYDRGKSRFTWYQTGQRNLQSNHVAGMAADSAGRIFIFTDRGVECPGEPGSFIPFSPAISFTFTRDGHQVVLSQSDGRIYLSMKNRLIIFDPASRVFQAVDLPHPVPSGPGIISHLQAGNNGNLFVVAAGGIYSFEPSSSSFTWLWQAPVTNKFAGDFKSFYTDRSDVAWVGTNAFGLYKINLRAVPFRSSPARVNFSRDALGQAFRKTGSLPEWFSRAATSYGFRYAYGPDKALWVSHQENEEIREPLSVLIIKDNKCIRALSPPGNQGVIRGLSRLPSGKMLAMDFMGNTWTWENDASIPSFSASALSLPKFSVVVDVEADGNALWVSTNKEGLFKIVNNRVAAHYFTGGKEKGWPVNQLTDLCPDPADKNVLWIGTLGYGLIRFQKSSNFITLFTEEEGLPNNTVYSIIPDSTGNLWLSTNKGISRFSPADNSFCNFDITDGLPGNEFNRFHHLRLPDGRIAFGTTDAIVSFDPRSFSADSFATRTVLTKILINNSPVEFTGEREGLPAPVNEMEKLTLPYNRNFLQVEFAGLQYNQPSKIKYRYQLAGYDKAWIETGNRNLAVYTKLPPGKYRLLINASNTSGKWSPQVRQLAIRIRPPVWASGLAFVLYTFIVLLLAAAYYRFRINRQRLQVEIAVEQSKAKHLQELDAIKERFFSNITHELRTPLTLILAPLEKLRQNSRLSETEQVYLGAAHRNAGQLLRLINQLLDISKIDSKQMKLQLTVGNLSDYVQHCMQQFYSAAADRSVQFFFTASQAEGYYQFDEDKWEKIIFNLLSNALKFTDPGGEIHVTLTGEPDTPDARRIFRLSVTDTGSGIAPSDIPRLFDRFYSADDTSRRSQKGTGIGLALVKELAELMNGSVQVQSTPGIGSSFTVRVPVAAIEGSPLTPVGTENAANPAGAFSTAVHPDNSPLLLIAEDNVELRSFLVRELSLHWRVLEAGNGKEAYEMIKQELPEIVISDQMMPEYTGETLCRLLKEDLRLAHISFIMLTARTAQQHVEAALAAGADAYLTKPFHLAELELRIRNLLLQQQRLRDRIREQLLPERPPNVIPHLQDVFLQKINSFLEENLDSSGLGVDQLAAAMSMSRRTLSRKLKTILNISPNDLIRRFRLQKAAILLTAGHPITETAYQVGFETPSYFSQCFKDQYGQTPTEFITSLSA